MTKHPTSPAPVANTGAATSEALDRRSVTSRKNLERYIKPSIGPTKILSAKVPAELIDRFDASRRERTRSECLREAITLWLEPDDGK